MKVSRVLWMCAAAGALTLTAARGDEDQIAYLGVATAPLPPVVAAQVGLPEGVGLIVAQVAPDGVAQGRRV